jgi:ribosomal protein L11 methyltransferase
MKTYLEVTISASETQRELLLPTMIELGFEGFQETDTELVSYIDKSRWSDDKAERLRDDLHRLIRTISSNADFRINEIVDRNWNADWEKTIQPIEIGEKLVIKPSWSDYVNSTGRIVLEIDPKMSFGTGYHETTRLVLRLLEKYIRDGATVFDAGTGTGILAIAAIALGASSAYGVDIDEWSIDNGQENVARNKVADRVKIDATPVEQVEGIYSLITANLTLNVNTALLADFFRLLEPGGLLLLSGLLNFDETPMKTALHEHGFEVIEQVSENEWIAVTARKPR